MKSILIICFSFILLTGCQNSNQDTLLTSQSTVATYSDGEVSLSDIDQYILSMPAHKRWSSETSPDDWYRNIINRIITEKKLLSEANLVGFNQDPIYKNKIRAFERTAYSNQYLATFDNPTGLSEADLKAQYDAHIDRYNRPESRRVYHLFKAFKGDQEKAKKDINSLRERIVAGENIELLVKQFSDSESRHKNGLIGNIKKGMMSPDFDEIIFSIEQDMPSEVIRTKDGYHIFYVSDILHAQSYDFDSVKTFIAQELGKQYIIDFIQEKAELLPPPEMFQIVSQQELTQLVRNRRNNIAVLTVNDFKLPLGQFMFELQQLKKTTGPKKDDNFAMHFLNEIAYREIIYQEMLKEKTTFNNPELLKLQKEQLLIEEYTQVKLKSYINQHPDLINSYFKKNKMRFSTPVQVKLERLIIPRKGQENAMNQLELAVEKLDDGSLSFNELAQEYNGQVQQLDYLTSIDLQKIAPQIINFAFLLKVNEHSPPFTTRNAFTIIKLIDRKEATERPLSSVRKHVIQQYVNENAADIFKRINKQLLEDVLINESALKAIHISLQQG